MTGNVRSITGAPVIVPEANAACVALAERLLELAKAGEIAAIAAAVYYRDEVTATHRGGVYGMRGMIGALEVLKAEIVQQDLET